jgi:hypothetical protein
LLAWCIGLLELGPGEVCPTPGNGQMTRMSGSAWMARWLQHPERPPTDENGEPAPAEYSYRIRDDGLIEFDVKFALTDGQRVTITTARDASDLELMPIPKSEPQAQRRIER